MEKKNYTFEEVVQKLKDEKVFSNLSDEGLKYLDSIVSNIIKLKELQDKSEHNSIGSLWFLFVMYLLSSSSNNAMSALASLNPSKE